MNTATRTAIVILAFNGWEDTRACLNSVLASDARTANILVVDNGSTDETATELPKAFPQVSRVRNASNLGYTEGNNVGLRYALAQHAEFIAVLNNDIVVAPNWLEPLLEAARGDERAGLLGPLVLHMDEPQVIQSAGGMLTKDWRSYHRGANETDAGQYAMTDNVAWLTGCAVLARSNALRDIGLLDNAFFMYGEDVDWGLRTRQGQYRVLFVPQSHVWHKGVRRNYAPAPYVTYYSARNELMLMRKHHAGGLALARAWARHLRTLASWSLRPRWRDQGVQRAALARAMIDFVTGTTGQINLV